MLFKTLGWQLPPRGIYYCVVEEAVQRMRNTQSDNSLPVVLSTWTELLAWAGCLKIRMPENEAVARSLKVGNLHPTMDWLNQSYQRFLTSIESNHDMPISHVAEKS